MKVLFILSIIFFSTCSNAVVKRHDVPPENYVIDKIPEYLIDMPHEGHGVLINSQWVVTVAHTIFYDYVGKDLLIGSKVYEIESIHIHPDYTQPNKNLLKGDLAPLMSFFKSRSDIALIKLASISTGTIIANHMEALDHCRLNRQNLRNLLTNHGVMERFIIPDDGETLKLS